MDTQLLGEKKKSHDGNAYFALKVLAFSCKTGTGEQESMARNSVLQSLYS